jgi:hypothetical protein
MKLTDNLHMYGLYNYTQEYSQFRNKINSVVDIVSLI